MLHNVFLRILGLVALFALAPTAASASDIFDKVNGDELDHAAIVSDEELAGMRGGFLDINGVLIDFNFLSRVQVGLEVQNNLNIGSSNIEALQMQGILTPQIIQNADNDTLITIQQALDLNIVNAGQLNLLSQTNQLGYQQSIDAH